MHDGYHPNLYEAIRVFHAKHRSTLPHIIYFTKVMNEYHIIHEDVWMYTFICTLEDKVCDYFYDDLVGPITSLPYFLRTFLRYWEPSLEDEERDMFMRCTLASIPK
jgi:hypothetical protein